MVSSYKDLSEQLFSAAENTESKKLAHDRHSETIKTPHIKNLSSEEDLPPERISMSFDQFFSVLGLGEGFRSSIILDKNIVELGIEDITGEVEGGVTFDFLKRIVGENDSIRVGVDHVDPKFAFIYVQSTDLELRKRLKYSGNIRPSDVMPPTKGIADKDWFLIPLLWTEIKKLPGLFRLRPGLDLEKIGIHLSEEDSDRYKRSKSGLNLGSLGRHEFTPRDRGKRCGGPDRQQAQAAGRVTKKTTE